MFLKLSSFAITACLLAVILYGCCEKEPAASRGMYYWKNTASELTIQEEATLSKLKVKKLYIKFFEVSGSDGSKPVPDAKTTLRFDAAQKAKLSATEIVPVVFVRNEVLKKTTLAAIHELAGNIVFLVKKYYGERFQLNGQSLLSELQIDCDWTPSTKDNYFLLLREIKKQSSLELSCTLRLYPYKYPKEMGIPPVDRATLMCYNLIHPLDFEDRNSILETSELEKYLRGVAAYPLELDVVLPVFSWMHIYRSRQFSGMLSRNAGELEGSIKKIRPMWYEVTRETSVDGRFLKPGDLLKFEEVTPAEIHKAIKLLKKNIRFGTNSTLSLYHLDKNMLQNNSYENLESFYTDFSR